MNEIERAIKTLELDLTVIEYTMKSRSSDALAHRRTSIQTALTVLRAELARQDAKPLTCEGCKESGLWDDEIEHGYNCPCMGCERNFPDRYEPKGEKA